MRLPCPGMRINKKLQKKNASKQKNDYIGSTMEEIKKYRNRSR